MGGAAGDQEELARQAERALQVSGRARGPAAACLALRGKGGAVPLMCCGM